MANLRGHEPIIIDRFNGLWQRGDADDVPRDHFSSCQNLKFIGSSEIGVRDGIGLLQDVNVPLSNVRRFYNYPTPTGNTVIVLVINDSDEGEIYHVVDSDTTFGPILTIPDMVDFAFQPYAGRGYISPIGYFTMTSTDGSLLNIEKGLENENLYVYAGDGTAARPAAGNPLTGNMTIANGIAGNMDAGLHIFGFVAETSSGYLTPPGALESFTTSASTTVSFTSVPTSGDPNIVRRHLVSSKAITDFNGNLEGYDLFFVPGGTIENDVDTFLLNVGFFDQDLLEDASFLLDNFSEIPAGAFLGMYHNRLILGATFDDINLVLVSAEGEPEAINQIDGLLSVVPDGNPVTNAQELRDILYIFKRARTVAFVDNGEAPSSWPLTGIDDALGTSIHGISTVLDSGGANVDKLIICTYAGILLFTGTYIEPPLTWKIEEFWLDQDRNEYRLIQIVNDPVTKRIMTVIPDQRILEGNYANGMTAKNMRWCPLAFPRNINTIAIVNIDTIILGMDLL